MEDVKPLLNRIFSGEDGKKFDDLLRAVCGVNKSAFSENPYRMAYNEGKRDVYETLMKLKEVKRG